jgi:hypothetical protein
MDIQGAADALKIFIVLAWVGTGVFAQFYRYMSVSSPVLRQQTKWVVYSFAAVLIGLVLITLPVILLPGLRSSETGRAFYLLLTIPAVLFALFLLPLSFGIAILRYRLWDIDILVRRTLVYGALTLTLGLIYFGSVVLLQSVVTALGFYHSAAVTAISTLIIAALFTPLRRRIQNDIDRRFYRKKYDAQKTLEAFAASAREEITLEDLAQDLLAVVENTLQPESVSMWLRPVNINRREDLS